MSSYQIFCSYKHFNFRINNDLNDKKYVFDEPNNNQLDNIAEEAITDCIQYFHRCIYKCEYKVLFVGGGEDGEEA